MKNFIGSYNNTFYLLKGSFIMRRYFSYLTLLLTFIVLSMELWAAAPTQNARYISFRNGDATSVLVRWLPGNGDATLVVMEEGTSVTDIPSDGSAYTAQTSGTVNHSTAATVAGTSQIIFNGVGRRVQVTNLTPNTTYIIRVFEYVSDGGTDPEYSTSTADNGQRTFTTDAQVPDPPSALDVAQADRTDDQFTITWTHSPTAYRDGYVVNLSDATTNDGTELTDFTNTPDWDHADIGDVSSFIIDDLEPETYYYFQIRTIANGDSSTWLNYDDQTGGTFDPICTLAEEPTNAPTGFGVDAYDMTSQQVSWSAGAGGSEGYLVYIREGSAVGGPDANPSTNDGADFTGADSDYSNSAQGSPDIYTTVPTVYFVANTSSTSTTVTGLNPGNLYYYEVFPYNTGTDVCMNNYFDTPLTAGGFPTISTEPSTPSGFAFTFCGVSLLSFEWDTDASVEYYLVLMKEGSMCFNFDATDNHPADGDDYTGDNINATHSGDWTVGAGMSQLWSGLGGTGSSTARAVYLAAPQPIGGKEFLSMANLTPGTNYSIRIYAINRDAGSGSENYSDPFETCKYTLFEYGNALQASNVQMSIPDCLDPTQVEISWTAGDDGMGGTENYLVVLRPSATSEVQPVDGTDYSDYSTDYSSSTETTGAGNVVVYVGTNTSTTVTGLTANTSYVATVYLFNDQVDDVQDCCTNAGVPRGPQNYSHLFPGDSEAFDTPPAVPTDPTGAISINVTADDPNELVLSWSAVGSVDGYFITGIEGNSYPTTDPECTYVYNPDTNGASDDFSDGYDISGGSLEYVIGYYSQSVTSATVTGLNSTTVYSFKLWTYNGTDYATSGETLSVGNPYAVNYSENPIQGQRTTLAVSPSSAPIASFLDPPPAENVGEECLYIELIGNGADNILVLMHTSAVADSPSDGQSNIPAVQPDGNEETTYGTDQFPSGTSYVVYNFTSPANGVSDTFKVTGLAASTVYHLAAWNYNGTSGSGEENFTGTTTDSRTTLATEPAQQAEFKDALSDAFTGLTPTQMNVNWKPGVGGPNYIVLASQGNNPIPSAHPVDGITYAPNNIWSSAPSITLSGVEWRFIYSGTSNSVLFNHGTPQTLWSFLIYSFDGSGGSENYLTVPDPDHIQRYSLSTEPTAGPALSACGAVSESSLSFTLTPAADGNYTVIYAHESSAVVNDPIDGEGEPVPQGTDFSTATSAGGGDKVIYAGSTPGVTPVNITVTGLNDDTEYYFEAWSYNALTGTTTQTNNYYTAASSTTSCWSLAIEPSVAGSVTLTNGSLIINWGAAPADQYMVVVNETLTPEATTPTDGTGYPPLPNTSQTFDWSTKGAADFGSSWIAYNGDQTSCTITNPTPASPFSVAVWAYNGSNTASYNYATSSSTVNGYSWDDMPPSPNAFTVTEVVGDETSLDLSDFSSTVTDEYLVFAQTGSNPSESFQNGTEKYGDNSTIPTAGTYNYGINAAPNGSFLVYRGSAPVFPLQITGFSACTEYYFTVYAYNTNGGVGPVAVYNYNPTGTSANGQTVAEEPSAQPTSLTFSNLVTDETATVRQYDVSWSNGASGPNYLVIAREGASPTGTPSDGSSYTANNTYASGDAIGDGYVVYDGTGTSFTFIAESNQKYARPYFFDVFSYDECGVGSNTENYLITSPLEGDDIILALKPTNSPTGLTPGLHGFNDVTDKSTMDLTWSSGGSKYIVIARLGAAPSQTPVNGTTYVADADIDGSSATIGDSNHFVVYTGTSTSVQVSGLNPGGDYYFSVHSFNCSNTASVDVPGSENYKTPPTVLNRHALQREPLIWTNAESATASGLQETTADISWPTATQDDNPSSATSSVSGYIAIAKVGLTASTGSPIDGQTSYTAAPFGTNPLGDGYIVYKGSSTSFTVNGLSTNTQYTVRIYSYDDAGFPTTVNYSEGMSVDLAGLQEYVDVTFSTLAPDPTSAPSGLTVTSRGTTDLGLSWTAGGGTAKSIVIVNEVGDGLPTGPTQGQGYSVGDFMNGVDGTNGTVKYVGSATTATITGLTPDQGYVIHVYGFNDISGSGHNYYPIAPPFYDEDEHTTLATESGSPSGLAETDNGGGSIDFSWTPGSNSLLVISTTATPGAPTDGTTYGGAGAAYGGDEVVFNGNGSSASFTATPGQTYHAAVYSYNGDDYTFNFVADKGDVGSQNYNASPSSASFVAKPSEPGAPSSVVFSNRTTSTMDIGWTGSGATNYLVVATSGTVTSGGGDPVDCTSYTANAAFGSGQAYGSGYVVYNGTGTSFTMSSLSADTKYTIEVWAFNEASPGPNAINYNPNEATGTHTTLATEPAQVSTLASPSQSTNSIDLTWSLNGAPKVIVLARESNPVGTDPTDGTTYSANATYSSGDLIGSSYVVYQGSGTTTTVTGLNSGTTYHFKAYGFDGDNCTGNEGSENYNTTSAPSASFNTTGVGTPDHLAFDASTFPAQFYSGNVYNVTVRLEDQFNTLINPTTNLTFDVTANATTVTSGTITTAQTSTTVNISYTDSDGFDDLTFTATQTGGTPTVSDGTHDVDVIADAPTNGPTLDNLTALSGSEIKVQYTTGSGNDGTLVMMRRSNSTFTDPTDGQQYSPSSSYTSDPGTQAIEADDDGDVTASNLMDGRTRYYFKLFDYKGDATDGTANYNVSSTDSGNERTKRSKIAVPGGEPVWVDGSFDVGSIQPNPAKDNIRFDLEVYEELPFSVNIYNSAGELVLVILDGRVLSAGTVITLDADLVDMPSGTYILQVFAGEEAIVEKFVIVD